MIPQKTVQQILDTARVEDVIGDVVQLKKRGTNLLGLCPFHNEKTPSFTVSPSKGIYKCFGCGVGGGAVNFLMEYNQMTYPEALRSLAKRYNIEVEEEQWTPEQLAEQKERESLFILTKWAAEYFRQQLMETDEGKSVGLSYFKQRGFREELIRKFDLGYAPVKKDSLVLAATQLGHKLEMIRKAGLATQNGGIDFFRDRVMFTIHDKTGKPVAFAGRTLKKDKKIPKYINSRETDIYHKSDVLYGLYQAKQAIRRQDECILVEGYTDVLSLHQAGVENVVASSGTSLTQGQIQAIKRHTPNIKILYDGDAAGIKAARRGIDLILEQNMNVKIVMLPDGEDPDSFVQREGATAFETFLDQESQDFILFFTGLLSKEASKDPVKKAEVVKDIIESITKIPDPIKRSFYVKQCADLMELDEQMLVREINKVLQAQYKKKKAKQQFGQSKSTPSKSSDSSFPTEEYPSFPTEEYGEYPPEETFVQPRPQQKAPATSHAFQERDIVRILIAFGSQPYEEEKTIAEYILEEIEDILDEFGEPTYGTIIKDYYTRIKNGQSVTPSHYIQHPDDDVRKQAVALLHTEYEYSPGWEQRFEIVLNTQPMPDQNFKRDCKESLYRFKLKKVEVLIKQNQAELKEAQEKGDQDNLMLTLQVQMKLIEMRNELAKVLKTVVLK